MSQLKPTNAMVLLADLAGGTLEAQLSETISDVANSALQTGKEGKITLELKFKRLSKDNTTQVMIAHKLAFKEPTPSGSRSEDTSKETPVYVNTKGDVSLFANHTADIFAEDTATV